MNIIEAIIIGIVEGVTEFLPISSTGHMIVTSSLLGIQKDEFTKLFEICIQLGGILAVVVLYWRKFFRFRHWQFYVKLIIGVIPALLFGFLFSDKIDSLLESPTTVAITMLLGGVVLLFIDNFFKKPTIESEEAMSNMNALAIGFWQVLSMIPGVSRSAASIIGGMQQKLTRSAAAEFSFFLAVPTMCAATGYKLLKGYKMIQPEHIKLLVVGNLVAFVVALLAIKFFINYLKVYGFRIFGIYRIFAGLILLVLIWMGIISG
jgi:undecaprenyl-diphosphatase